MVNTHGLRMLDLRKVSSDTKNLTGYYSGLYYQINYDKETGEVFDDYHCSLGQNWWTQYENENVVNCGNISSPATMQTIADMVWRKVQCAKELQSISV